VAKPETARSETDLAAELPQVAYVAGLDPFLKFGSLEEQILLLSCAFQQRGARFLPVYAGPLGGEAARQYAAAGVSAEAVDLSRFEMRRLRALLGILDRHVIEVVHWSFYHLLNPYVWALSALRPRLRHLFTDHNSRWFEERGQTPNAARMALKNALLSRYEQIVCVSDFVAEALRRDGVRARLTPCAHFINTERFRPDASERLRVRDELEARDKFVVLVVGRLIEEKGVSVLLRAAARLPSELVVWVVGDGNQAGELARLAEELSIDARVRFLGDRGRVEPFMQAADCLACPVVWDEAAGLVNIEGLACGLPVVASRAGGIPEIVDDGRTGLLVAPGDVDALAGALHRLQKEPELRERMSLEARQVALERYAPESRLPGFIDLYPRRPGGKHVR
jgi:glycosyltransferase involved in cell wall biosynthesis